MKSTEVQRAVSYLSLRPATPLLLDTTPSPPSLHFKYCQPLLNARYVVLSFIFSAMIMEKRAAFSLFFLKFSLLIVAIRCFFERNIQYIIN